MIINGALIAVLFCLSVPGVVIAMRRLVALLLPHNTKASQRKASRLIIGQTLITVFAMSFTGSLLSTHTHLGDPVLDALFQKGDALNIFLAGLFPAFLAAIICFILFVLLYYLLIRSILDEQSMTVMNKLRACLKVDGCILYGGIVEELIGRWGLMNLVAFFAMLFTKQLNNNIIISSLLISSLLFAIGQVPIYIAAGCTPTRRCIYSIISLSLCQSLCFGFIFWQYGLIAAIIAHVLFHLFWALYDRA